MTREITTVRGASPGTIKGEFHKTWSAEDGLFLTYSIDFPAKRLGDAVDARNFMKNRIEDSSVVAKGYLEVRTEAGGNGKIRTVSLIGCLNEVASPPGEIESFVREVGAQVDERYPDEHLRVTVMRVIGKVLKRVS